jgi:RHS repeat-associated protein
MLLRFPGQWEDGVGGFYQNAMREYSEITSRYSQVDFLGLVSSRNFYSYVANRPARFFDNYGLAAVARPLGSDDQDKNTIYCDTDNSIKVNLGNPDPYCPEVNECIKLHEDVHRLQIWWRYGGRVCENLRLVLGADAPFLLGEGDSSQRMADEAWAFMLECQCLRTKMASATPDCCVGIKDMICEINIDIKTQIESGVYPAPTRRGFSGRRDFESCSQRCENINR